MPRIIAVTGATGFIGRMLVNHLRGAGWSLRLLVRPGTLSSLPSPQIGEIVPGSLEDPVALEQLVDGVYAVIHCAGAVRGSTFEDFSRVNIDGVKRLVRAALNQPNSPRFLFLSSLAAREPQLSHYASSKRLGEQVLADESGDMEWVALRPPAVYGPGDREMLPLFQWMGRGIAPILGEPLARLSLLYVEDLTAAILSWLDSGGCRSGVYEITDTQNDGYSWEEVTKRVSALLSRRLIRVPLGGLLLRVLAGINLVGARILGYAPMLTPGKVREIRHPDWVGNNGELTAALGWTPKFSLEDGLHVTMGWGRAPVNLDTS